MSTKRNYKSLCNHVNFQKNLARIIRVTKSTENTETTIAYDSSWHCKPRRVEPKTEVN